jgi:hypothetical protein
MHAAADVRTRSLFVRHGTLTLARSADRDYRFAKAYLSRDGVERNLFERLEHARGRHYRLTINHHNDDHFDPTTDTIAWDPRSALRTTGGRRQSPALGLGHEIDHAVESRGAEAALAATLSRRYDTAEERRVITGSERHAAHTLGEGVRFDHDGTCYRVASAVCLTILARSQPRNAQWRVESAADVRTYGFGHAARTTARSSI